MNKTYYSLGLMSGTSGDGVDSSVIISDGRDQMVTKYNNYDLYPSYLSEEIHKIKEKIKISNDLSKYSSEINLLEDKLTNFHAIVANKWLKRIKIDIIGFHGQTIFHNSNEKLSKQLGLGKKLSDLTKTTVVYNFRQNDLKNGGEGAPLAAIYHKLIVMKLVKKRKMKVPAIILNIGGISNITTINKNYEITSEDIGPGNCLIDKWIRENSNKNFDKFGNTAKNGKIDKFILQQSLHSYFNSKIFHLFYTNLDLLTAA